MQALAALPNLRRLQLVIDAFGNEEAAERYAQESLPVLQNSTGLSDIILKPRSPFCNIAGRTRELRNCDRINIVGI